MCDRDTLIMEDIFGFPDIFWNLNLQAYSEQNNTPSVIYHQNIKTVGKWFGLEFWAWWVD